MLVCDSSTIVALLTDSGPDGEWAARMCMDDDLVAPALLPFECASVLNMFERTGVLDTTSTAQAHDDLLALRIELWPFELLADGVRAHRYKPDGVRRELCRTC